MLLIDVLVAIVKVRLVFGEVTMTDSHKDLLNGLVFVTGLIGFMLGEFIISSALFAATTYASNVNMNRKKHLNDL